MPPDKGLTFIVADYGQLELRLLAHMSNCLSMIRAFKEVRAAPPLGHLRSGDGRVRACRAHTQGGDFHSRTAIGMYPHVAKAVANKEVLLEWDSSQGAAPAPLLKNVFAAERRKAKVRRRGRSLDAHVRDARTRTDAQLLHRLRQDRARARAGLGREPHGGGGHAGAVVLRPTRSPRLAAADY